MLSVCGVVVVGSLVDNKRREKERGRKKNSPPALRRAALAHKHRIYIFKKFSLFLSLYLFFFLYYILRYGKAGRGGGKVDENGRARETATILSITLQSPTVFLAPPQNDRLVVPGSTYKKRKRERKKRT